jgi:hypothetical protein
LILLCHLGCARTEIPDPRDAARTYQEAVERGDPQALHALLSEEGRVAYSPEDIALLLEQDRMEIQAQAASVNEPDARVEGRARVMLADQREAELTFSESRFWVQGTLALPFQSQSPEELLQSLATALDSRSLPLLLSLLTEEQRSRVEERLDALSASLALRNGAVVRVRGERAEIELPDGQLLVLRRQHGSWQIEELP